MRKITKALSFANVMASVAVFLALGGAAFAAQQAAKNSVTSASIKNGAVTGKDVKDDSLTGADVNEGTLALADETRPTGPAGGDLTGVYPNPVIGPAAIGTGELADAAVNSAKIANDSITTSKIKDSEVGSAEISTGAVRTDEIDGDSVGSDELKGVTAVVGPGVTVNAGTPQTAQVTCPPGRALIGAGYAWQDDEANSIIHSAPNDADPNRSWLVRGMVDAGSNTLFAWANCMQL
jgi:hypothetical protein